MILLAGPLLLILLVVAAMKAKRAGRSGTEIMLLVVAGVICIAALNIWIFSMGLFRFRMSR